MTLMSNCQLLKWLYKREYFWPDQTMLYFKHFIQHKLITKYIEETQIIYNN